MVCRENEKTYLFDSIGYVNSINMKFWDPEIHYIGE